MSIYAEMMATPGCRPNTRTLTMLIDAHAKRRDGRASVAAGLFKLLVAQSQGLPLKEQVVGYNCMVDVHAKCRDGSAQQANALLADMIRRGLRPSTVTCVAR